MDLEVSFVDSTHIEPQRQAPRQAVEDGPFPAVNGVARCRLIDLAQWLFGEPRLVVSKRPLRCEPRNMGTRQALGKAVHWAAAQAASPDYLAAGHRNREHGDPD